MSEKENKKKPFKGMVEFFKDVKGELKKVIWPTYKQVVNNSIIVITAVIIVGIFIGILDFGFSWGLGKFVNKAPEVTDQTTQENGSMLQDENGNPIEITPEMMEQIQQQQQQQQQGAESTEQPAPTNSPADQGAANNE